MTSWALIRVLAVTMFLPVGLQAARHILSLDQESPSFLEIIESAQAHDTIIIEKGIYQVENITLDKPLHILGQDGASLVSITGEEILLITSDSVTVQGLSFSGVTTSYLKERAAIRLVKVKHFNIRNNRIDTCFFGIYLEHVSHGIIAGNHISGNATTEAGSGNAIHAWYCNNLEISSNEVLGHRDGIYFEFVDESIIENNYSHDNMRYGLHFMFSNDDSYRNNTFEDNGSGVAVMFSREIEMISNRFAHNWGGSSYGLLLKEMNDAEIRNNIFLENTIGIFVEGSNRVQYHHNSFKQNGWAIKFSGGCSQNEITQNNFLYNSMDLVMVTKLSDNKIYQNYWSEYTGYDLDKDEIGDIPHYPVKLFSYILQQVPEAVVLMRSFFVRIVNFAEKVSPVFTPKEVFDSSPLMYPVS